MIEGQRSCDGETHLILNLEKTVRASGMYGLVKNEVVESDDLHLLRKARDDAFDRIVHPIVNRAISNHPKE